METRDDAKYQLRSMYLVNAGTNKSRPSNRITSVDPRGGALVMGPNGVGKTLTLRLLPLFFGFSPNRLLGDNDAKRGSMVEFILPDDRSAIAFEYQRGDESELRLAVMRRDPKDHRAPFYRIFHCGWDPSLFVRDGLFLTDEEGKALTDVKYSKRLTVAEYHCVILRTAVQTKDKSIRGLQADYSFAPVPLDNLDKLVAAMVKDSVNLDAIKAVAVSRAQQNLGRTGESGRLNFRQKQSDLHSWLNSNRAGQTVIDQADQVDRLSATIERVHELENARRALWWDVHTLKEKRESQVLSCQEVLDKAQALYQVEQQREEGLREDLNDAARRAEKAFGASQTEYKQLDDQRKWLEKEQAPYWKEQQPLLAGLKAQKNSLAEQIDIATAQHKDAVQRYETLRREARDANSVVLQGLQESKGEPREAFERSLKAIDAAERETADSIRAESVAQLDELQTTRAVLAGDRGQAQERCDNPSVSPQTQEELRFANAALQDLQRKLIDATAESSKLAGQSQQAKGLFEKQEMAVQACDQRVLDAQAELLVARNLLAPDEGSLLHALRTHPDQDWKMDLARVLDPQLLHRKDLSPQWLDEDGTMFGWGLQCERIEPPGWSEDAALRARVQRGEEMLGAVQQQSSAARLELERRSKALHEAQEAKNRSSAAVQILRGQIQEQGKVLARAQLALENERKDAKEQALAALSRITQEIAALDSQVRGVQVARDRSIAQLRESMEAKKAVALAGRDAAISAIDSAIGQARSQLNNDLQTINEQERTHLTSSGVDVKVVEGKRKEVESLTLQIRNIENKDSVIQAWNEFVQSAGESRLLALEAQLRLDRGAHEKALRDISEQQKRWNEYSSKALGELEGHREQIRRMESDAVNLQALENAMGVKPAFVLSTVDSSASYDQMKGRFASVGADLAEAERSLGNQVSALQNVLVAADPQVNKFVTDWMGQRVSPQASMSLKASELVHCYRRLGTEFIQATNQHLRAILSNISSLQTAIAEFETEVRGVNTRLQAGLSQIKCFERIQDLTLNIQPTFEDLGFYKMLRRISDAIRDYELNRHMLDDTKPAPREITAAVAEFASVLGNDGNLDVDLASHITLSGSVRDNGTLKEFKRDRELAGISSNGLSAILRITLVMAIINTMRGTSPIFVPWVTDEIGTFDGPNLRALMQMLADNRIDVITAAPDLDPLSHTLFAHRYLFQDQGRIRERPSQPMQSVMNTQEGVAA